MASRSGRLAASTALVLVSAVLALGLLGPTPHRASAAAPPVTQCNDDTASNVGGQGIACTVTIVNDVTGSGATDTSSPSTVYGDEVRGRGRADRCGRRDVRDDDDIATEPVTLVQQCNGSGNGGGGVVRCAVTVTNHFTSSGTAAPAPTAVQCPGMLPTQSVSRPPATGNAGPAAGNQSQQAAGRLLGMTTVGLILRGRRLVASRWMR